MLRADFTTLDEMENVVGTVVARSDWFTVTQEAVNAFADVSGDHQWIHIDPERARRESPYGTTIAHGFYTLSLLTRFLHECITLPPGKMGINYGCDRVRFVAAVPVGSEISAAFVLGELKRMSDGAQFAWDVEITVRDAPKPSLVARWLSRWVA